MQAAGRRVQGPTQKPEVALDAAEATASRMLLQYSMHPLTTDEQVTCQSMLVQEPSSRVLVMPTHHINELGDMMGFRWRHAMPFAHARLAEGFAVPAGSRATSTHPGTVCRWFGPCFTGTRW